MTAEYDISMKWLSFPLHPETPSEGVLFSDLYDQVALQEKMERVYEYARRIAIPFSERKRRYNPRLAHELSKWVEERRDGMEFHHRVFQAYFVDQLNIAQIPVLVRIVESMGLPGSEARDVLEKRVYRERIDREWRRAEAMGISAVPSCVMENRVLAGAQPYETFESFVKYFGYKLQGIYCPWPITNGPEDSALGDARGQGKKFPFPPSFFVISLIMRHELFPLSAMPSALCGF